MSFFGLTWNKNFQIYRLGFEEAEKPEIKLPTFTGSWRKQRRSSKTSTSASLTMLKSLTMFITINCGKFSKRWEYQPALLASWETCMWIKKQQLELDVEHRLVPNRKRVRQGCILSPCLFNFYAEYIMRNAGLEEAQAGIKIAGRNIIASDMQKTPPLRQKAKEN